MYLRLLVLLSLVPLSAFSSGWGGEEPPPPTYYDSVAVTCETPEVSIVFSGGNYEQQSISLDHIVVSSMHHQFADVSICPSKYGCTQLEYPKVLDPKDLFMQNMDLSFRKDWSTSGVEIVGSGGYRNSYFDLRIFNNNKKLDIFFTDLASGIIHQTLSATCSQTSTRKPLK